MQEKRQYLNTTKHFVVFMWLAKFKIKHKNCVLTPKAVKYNVVDLVYVLNSWNDQKNYYYTELHILQGKEENKKRFVHALKKEKTVKKVEAQGNYIFSLNKEPLEKQYYSPVFDQRLLQPKPIVVSPDGFEYWEMACWDKKPLMEILKVPVFKAELRFIKNIKLAEIYLPKIYPQLSSKQQEAIELAVKEGYYDYPRRIYLEKLAHIAKVKRQSYQENLRRAEKKLVPFLTERMT